VGLISTADTISAAISPGSEFAVNLEEVTASYYDARKLRLPTIYAYPPYAFGREEIATCNMVETIPVVLNYQTRPGRNIVKKADESWPPQVKRGTPKYWPHAVSPVCLELVNHGYRVSGAFLIHHDLIGEVEKLSLFSYFFDTVWELIQ
jgi:hypothetical protein